MPSPISGEPTLIRVRSVTQELASEAGRPAQIVTAIVVAGNRDLHPVAGDRQVVIVLEYPRNVVPVARLADGDRVVHADLVQHADRVLFAAGLFNASVVVFSPCWLARATRLRLADWMIVAMLAKPR